MYISEEWAPKKEGWEPTEATQSPQQPWCGLAGMLLGISSGQSTGALAKKDAPSGDVLCLPALLPGMQQQ